MSLFWENRAATEADLQEIEQTLERGCYDDLPGGTVDCLIAEIRRLRRIEFPWLAGAIAESRDATIEALLDDAAAKEAHLLKVIADRDRFAAERHAAVDHMRAAERDFDARIAAAYAERDSEQKSREYCQRLARESGTKAMDLEEEVARLRAALESARRDHDAGGRCASKCGDAGQTGGSCDCGADAHNAEIEKALRGGS